MNYVVYLDEFGHVGPFISRDHDAHNTSPVFGLAGVILPIEKVREFGTWFFQHKNNIFKNEIKDTPLPLWEKKGTELYTVQNIENIPNFLKNNTYRLFNKINKIGGYVFYVGEKKKYPPDEHNSNSQYIGVLLEAIKRINQFCSVNSNEKKFCRFFLVLDKSTMRKKLVTKSAIAMYNVNNPRKHLIEQPFEVESDRYQNIQVADWIATIVGRIGAYRADPTEYSDYALFSKYFEQRLKRISVRCGMVRCGIRM